jgi:hypothetical protein
MKHRSDASVPASPPTWQMIFDGTEAIAAFLFRFQGPEVNKRFNRRKGLSSNGKV